MTITIIGSGKMGSGFALLLVSTGFDIAIGHKNPEKAVGVAGKVGVGAKGGSVKEAVGQADVIIIAVKYEDAADALTAAGDLTNKIVIDISNPITADFKGPYDWSFHLGRRDSEARSQCESREGVQHYLCRASPDRKSGPRKVQVFVAADDETAKAKVSDIVMAVEFEPVDSGPSITRVFSSPWAR